VLVSTLRKSGKNAAVRSVFICHDKSYDSVSSNVCVIRFPILFIVFGSTAPPPRHGLLTHEVSRSHTTTHHCRYDSSGRAISPTQRPLPDNTQHSQQTNIHAPVGFEPTISAGERPQTYALDRAATGTGFLEFKTS